MHGTVFESAMPRVTARSRSGSPFHSPAGWLIKLGGSGLTPKNWRKRWFVLMNNTVYYYKTPSDSAVRVATRAGTPCASWWRRVQSCTGAHLQLWHVLFQYKALGAFYLPGYRVMPPKPGKKMHNKHGFMVSVALALL